jgi:ABC-type Mn2+/Zn2+ transport system permease subunit/Mn-dependent DtxR family transcriptional regulator
MLDLLGPLLDPVTSYGFMRAGLVAAVVVGLSASVLSCLLVVRSQALLGDAISHAVLLGVVVGYLVAEAAGVFVGALVVAVATGTLITYVERHSPVKLDAVMGICFTAVFALGLAILSVADPRGIDLFHILFGNVLGVSGGDLVLTAVAGGLVLVGVAVGFRAFHLWSFDPVMARAVGMRVGALQYAFTGLLSATIVASLQAVGLILVVALLITPGATALLLTTRLRTMMLVAAGVGLLAAVGGLYASYYLDVASGPAIVLSATLLFAAAFLLAPRRGVLSGALRRRRVARRSSEEDLLKSLHAAEDPDAAEPPVTEPDASRVRALQRRGLVEGRGESVALTAAGRREALRMVRAHRLLERYAHDAEGLALDELHDDAEQREHQLDDAEIDDLDQLLGRPAVDPHGHPIPTVGGELAAIAGRPLSSLAAGEPGVVTMVRDDRAELLRQMVALGILPERPVTVLGTVAGRREGAVEAVVDGVRVSVPGEVADRVFVRRAPGE